MVSSSCSSVQEREAARLASAAATVALRLAYGGRHSSRTPSADIASELQAGNAAYVSGQHMPSRDSRAAGDASNISNHGQGRFPTQGKPCLVAAHSTDSGSGMRNSSNGNRLGVSWDLEQAATNAPAIAAGAASAVRKGTGVFIPRVGAPRLSVAVSSHPSRATQPSGSSLDRSCQGTPISPAALPACAGQHMGGAPAAAGAAAPTPAYYAHKPPCSVPGGRGSRLLPPPLSWDPQGGVTGDGGGASAQALAKIDTDEALARCMASYGPAHHLGCSSLADHAVGSASTAQLLLAHGMDGGAAAAAPLRELLLLSSMDGGCSLMPALADGSACPAAWDAHLTGPGGAPDAHCAPWSAHRSPAISELLPAVSAVGAPQLPALGTGGGAAAPVGRGLTEQQVEAEPLPAFLDQLTLEELIQLSQAATPSTTLMPTDGEDLMPVWDPLSGPLLTLSAPLPTLSAPPPVLSAPLPMRSQTFPSRRPSFGAHLAAPGIPYHALRTSLDVCDVHPSPAGHGSQQCPDLNFGRGTSPAAVSPEVADWCAAAPAAGAVLLHW